ncbi:MAG: permease-like cell division protein FtsX [Alistipes sp.]|jgi:cell division transport system permease protein|nr:permease-like cell division protein FtsX [Alistipes sp.]
MKQTDRRLRRRVRNSYFISTVSIAMVLFLLGSVSYLILNALNVTQRLKESVTVFVMLDDDRTAEQTAALRKSIENEAIVREVVYVPKEEAAERFIAESGEDFSDFIDFNPLPDSFEVGLVADAPRFRLGTGNSGRKAGGAEASEVEASEAEASGTGTDAGLPSGGNPPEGDEEGSTISTAQTGSTASTVESFAKMVEAMPGVYEVDYQKSVVEQIGSNLGKFELVLLFFGGTLLLISLILLSNTIRMTIVAKRHTINTMKLVGANRGFIMRPFLASALLHGLYAGLIATAMFALLIFGLREGIPEIRLLTGNVLLTGIGGGMIVSGIVISLLFTLFAVSRAVNQTSDRAYF